MAIIKQYKYLHSNEVHNYARIMWGPQLILDMYRNMQRCLLCGGNNGHVPASLYNRISHKGCILLIVI